jgi:hypothetical protein
MGKVEDAVRREVEGNSALAEMAYKLAREIDLDAGGVAAVRELRAVLRELRERRGAYTPARLTLVPDEDEDLAPDLADDEVLEVTKRDGSSLQVRRRARAGEIGGSVYLNGVRVESL